MKKCLLTLLLFFNACNLNIPLFPDFGNDIPKLPRPSLTGTQQDKARNEPHFAVNFNGFLVTDEPSNASGATASDHAAAGILTSDEKTRMLELLDLVRLIVNSSEFETEMRTRTYHAARSANGPNGSISPGYAYRHDRLLEIINNITLYVQIRKMQISTGAAAVGLLGSSLYVMADDDPRVENSYWLAFPNRDNWSEGDYQNDEGFMSSILFHEILHNAGFSHLPFVGGRPDPNDVVYQLQEAYEETYNIIRRNGDFQRRRTAFEPFYPEVFASHVSGTTYPIANFSINPYSNLDEEDPIICVIQADGSFKLMKLSELS